MALPYKTTAKDFALFKKTFQYYVQKFGMHEWGIRYVWEYDETESMSAAIAKSSTGKAATVYLHKNWALPVTDKEIKRSAVHEFAHLLTADLEDLVVRRCVMEDERKDKSEALARRFENFFYGDK